MNTVHKVCLALLLVLILAGCTGGDVLIRDGAIRTPRDATAPPVVVPGDGAGWEVCHLDDHGAVCEP